MVKACEIWKTGFMLKLFIRSARIPEKVWLVRNTSFSTSRDTFSTVPGFFNPSACLRSRNDAFRDWRAADTGFSVKKASGFDSMANDIVLGRAYQTKGVPSAGVKKVSLQRPKTELLLGRGDGIWRRIFGE
jgi:hypothetical protein